MSILNLGYISSKTDSNGTTSYYYDNKGQLTRVDDPVQNYTFTYAYNNAGNITAVYKYTFGNPAASEIKGMVTYNYDTVWKDRVKSAPGVGAITYDAIGNPITYGSNSFAWTAGRQLESVTNSNNSISYKYDSNGIRTQKTVNGVTTTYILNSSNQVVCEQTGTNNPIYYIYDENGTPLTIIHNGNKYHYLINQQGDVIGIANYNGRLVVEYTYDAWGKLLSTTGVYANTVGKNNRLRYRGYYYDEETGYYYLQSRYYDPTIGRFINADDTEYIGASGTELSYNIFAYCENNSIIYTDPDGCKIRLSGLGNQQKIMLSYLQIITSHKLYVDSNGYVKIRKKSKQSKYPKGDKLIIEMISSSKTCTINLSRERDKEGNNNSRIKYASNLDTSNGRGSSSTILLNNIDAIDVFVMDKNGIIRPKMKNGYLSDERAYLPNYIILAHELIHAYRASEGRRLTGKGSYTYRLVRARPPISGSKTRVEGVVFATERHNREEFATVGLKYNKPYDITENDIRKEHGLPLRARYGRDKNKSYRLNL